MIDQIKIMRGPNLWSTEVPHIAVIKLDYDIVNQLDTERLLNKLPDLFPDIEEPLGELHKNQNDKEGFLCSLFSLLAITIENSARKSLSFYEGKVLHDTSYYSIFEYEDEEVAKEAAYLAEDIILTLSERRHYNGLRSELSFIADVYEKNSLGPSSQDIINAAKSRDIPVTRDEQAGYTILGQGKYMHRIAAAMSDKTSCMGVDIAGDKNLTKALLEDAMLPVPKGEVISTEADLEGIFKRVGTRLVTKPLDGHQGKCITADITTRETLIKGFRSAKKYSRKVIVEQHVHGYDFRFLVINYKLVAVAKRSPALVTGNGRSTIRELIEEVNADPGRGKGHGSALTKIVVDDITHQILEEANSTLDTVLDEGVVQILKDTANLSTGGTAEDVTDQVHPFNRILAERTARVMGLDICGIDIMSTDITTPITENGAAIIEVNAAPGLRMHIAPSAGKPREVGKAIVDMMYPEDETGRIPIIAITGTNGKTTTSRLMAHVVQAVGFRTGFTTTDGIYIDGQQAVSGDCSGPRSSALVLQDKAVEFAVLECARGGILRSGLAFDKCDIGIVTNVAADHLGQNDINTVEDMARVKEVVVRSVEKDGYAILNAAQDLVYQMKKSLECNIALFALDEKNKHIVQHCKKGGVAAVLDSGGYIAILDGSKKIRVGKASKIPVTLEGRAGFMIENLLPVVLSAYVSGFPMDKVKEALMEFHPSAEQTPGRMNIMDVGDKKVIVDYAHNPHSIKAFSEFMANIKEPKIGIITGVGDRRDEDIEEVGQLAAQMYDEVIIRIDEDTRGRKADNIIEILRKGIDAVDPELPCKVIPDLSDALEHAVHHAKPGSYIIMNVESVKSALSLVKSLQGKNGHAKKTSAINGTQEEKVKTARKSSKKLQTH